MSSEILGGAENVLKGNLGGAWDIKHGYAAAYTDLGIGRRFGGAAAAYSLRDVGAMNGPVVDVRCSSGTLPFTALQVSSGDVEAFVGSGNDGFVSKWYDQSGNGRHMIQSDTADQPRIVNSGTLETDPGGNPTIKFLNVGTGLGSTFLENSSPVALAAGMTQFFVTSVSVDPTGDRFTFAGGASDSCIDDKRLELRRGGTNKEAPSLEITVGSNEVLVYNTNSSFLAEFHINASSETATGITGTAGENAFEFLGENSASAGNDTFGLQGTMSEAIVYNTDLDTDITNIKNNINSYYSIY
tara:strand:- start:38 stop:934 length:897 start_codon:yes stop_codon:yes gene_type:complete